MKKLLLFLSIFAFLIAGLSSCKVDDDLGKTNDESLKSASVAAEAKYVPNEMLVKFKDGVNEAQKSAVLAKVSGKMKEKILTKVMEKAGDNEGITLVTVSGPALDAISRVKGLAEVEYAEPNYIYEHCLTNPNDTYFANGFLWGMYGNSSSPANQYGSQAAVSWATGKTGSSNVYVGIIDEGYMNTHVDLATNAGVNPGETAGDGIDNDANGLVDDVYGWDFANNDKTIFDGTASNDVDHHGTHVAGTIGGIGNNGIGVAGVCWTVRFLSGKFLGPNGGTTANAVKAVDYFTNLKTKQGLRIVATNNSWGGGGFSLSLYNAISRANDANILFIAAAGNSGEKNDKNPSFPASYCVSNRSAGRTYPGLPNVIAVAAISSTGGLASWSQYGAKSVQIGAPGVDIWSTLPNVGYGSYSGTSMATPHVTGAAALYAASHSGASAADIKKAILDSATPTASLSGKCTTGGRLNVSGF